MGGKINLFCTSMGGSNLDLTPISMIDIMPMLPKIQVFLKFLVVQPHIDSTVELQGLVAPVLRLLPHMCGAGELVKLVSIVFTLKSVVL